MNVEFVEVISRSEVRQRTWERGSGETWACGTGASAVCVAGVLTGRTDAKSSIVCWGAIWSCGGASSDNHVYMTGPAVRSSAAIGRNEATVRRGFSWQAGGRGRCE